MNNFAEICLQARAPNSPVLIVGTHFDKMREQYPASRSEDLQQLIREKYEINYEISVFQFSPPAEHHNYSLLFHLRFVNIVDAEKCGLPRVLDTIEVSCKTRHNIKLLCNLIYDTVFSLRLPGKNFFPTSIINNLKDACVVDKISNSI